MKKFGRNPGKSAERPALTHQMKGLVSNPDKHGQPSHTEETGDQNWRTQQSKKRGMPLFSKRGAGLFRICVGRKKGFRGLNVSMKLLAESLRLKLVSRPFI